MKFKHYTFLILLIFYVSCENLNNKINIKQIENNTVEILNKLNFKNDVIVKSNNNKIQLSIHFKEKLFLTKSSNEILSSVILYQLSEKIKSIDSIDFIYSFNGIIDSLNLKYPKNTINSIKTNFDSNELFYMTVIYSLKQLNGEQLIGFNESIKDLNHFVPENFSFIGNFWEFLFEYSKNACSKEFNFNKQMELLLKSASYPKNINKPKVIQGLINLSKEYCTPAD